MLVPNDRPVSENARKILEKATDELLAEGNFSDPLIYQQLQRIRNDIRTSWNEICEFVNAFKEIPEYRGQKSNFKIQEIMADCILAVQKVLLEEKAVENLSQKTFLKTASKDLHLKNILKESHKVIVAQASNRDKKPIFVIAEIDFDIARSNFFSAFRKAFDCSPIGLKRTTRLTAIYELLRQGISPQIVAKKMGYVSEEHFRSDLSKNYFFLREYAGNASLEEAFT